MRGSSTGAEHQPVVAIIGGGASGTLTAIHLRRHHNAPHVVLIDKYGRHGLGQAYSTEDPRHLLNACVAKMGAVADDPDHLLRWTRAEGFDLAGADYLPRREYGRYLRELLDRAAVEERTDTVTALRPGARWTLDLAGGGTLEADAVVLATGNREPLPWPQITPCTRYIADPWAPGALDKIDDDDPVLVVGTGLTMVDITVSATHGHPDRIVYALSRHGLLPRPHRCPAPPPASITLPDSEDLTLPVLLRAVRAAIRANDGEWHGVIDALRPHVPALWAALPHRDRKQFLRLMSRYWEVHRHRIPPATTARVEALRSAGRLRVLRGRLTAATGGDAGMTATLDGGRTLPVGWIVNATGPGHDIAADPFFAGLFAAGIATPDPLGLGLDATPSGAVRDALGDPQRTLFTLGPTLRGLRYETTAIPEIRMQAAALARRLAGLRHLSTAIGG